MISRSLAHLLAFGIGFAAVWGVPGFSNEKGGGMGNGGIALQCPGRELEMLDTAFPDEPADSARVAIPETREGIETRIRERLSAYPELRDRILSRYEDFGPSESWSNGDWPGTYDAFLPRPLPRRCKLVQVAYFQDGKPLRREENYQRLKIPARRVLELHETVFSVGVHEYHHANPVLSRMLILELLSGTYDAEATATAVHRFSLMGTVSRVFDYLDAFSPAPTLEKFENLTGVFKLARASHEASRFLGKRGCPEYVVLESVQGRGSQVAFADGLGTDRARFRAFSQRLGLRAQTDSRAALAGGRREGGSELVYFAAKDRLELRRIAGLACAYERDPSAGDQKSPNYLIRLSDRGLMGDLTAF